jgi:stage III sporulation protein AA
MVNFVIKILSYIKVFVNTEKVKKGKIKMKKHEYFYTLTPKLRAEICSLLTIRKKNISDISEIRLRSGGALSVYLGNERYFLSCEIDEFEINEIFKSLSKDGVYSHTDTVNEGYITLDGGIRVGISARARYDKNTLYSFGEISSMIFRIPTETSIKLDTLPDLFEKCTRGMLIFSPPRYGKTSALRALAKEISFGREGREVVVLDERLEFSSIDRHGLNLDILSGYKKIKGIEIALRSLSPEVIIMDELSDKTECEKLLEFMRGGVRVIASAHAENIDDLKHRAGVRLLLENGVFDKLVAIRLSDGKREYVKYD